MKILVLQLKRIGDLVLTAPALAELRRQFPSAQITLAVAEGCAALVPAIPAVDQCLVFKKWGCHPAFWRGLLFTRFDVCLDFTGNDRSAFFTALSKAPERIGFEWMKASRARALAYNRWVDSAVRDHHTVDHYLHLLRALECHYPKARPALVLPESAKKAAASLLGLEEYVVIHPGTAREEKYWEPERWAAVIRHIQTRHRCVITGGSDPFERAHIAKIQSALEKPCIDLSGKIELLTFAAVIAGARMCLSCDTAAVHLAAAFLTSQVALYGVTNPFHWRPRHSRAVVISAAQPGAPLTDFQPRMKGAPMSAISTEAVLSATDALLAGLVTP